MCWCASMRRRGGAINDLIVLLDGQNITGAFRPETGRHSLLGLVGGLTVGQNSLVAKAIGPNNETYRSANLMLTNYPITGPILSAPRRTVLLHDSAFYPARVYHHIGSGSRRGLFDCDQGRLCLSHDGRTTRRHLTGDQEETT